MLDGAIVLDAATGQIVLANQAAADMFGLASPAEIAGRNPIDYVPKRDRERLARMIADAFETGRAIPTELEIRAKGGRSLWVSASAAIIQHEGKKAALATIRDITSEKNQGANLKEAERQYERLFDSMRDGAVVVDNSTLRVVYANQAAAGMFGFVSPKDMIGANPLDFVREEDRDEVTRTANLSLKGKETGPAEIRAITTDKRVLWISANVTAIDHEGRKATLAMLRDITGDKTRDAKLKATEESRTRLMDAANEAISIVQDGKFVYVNPALARGAGVSEQQIIGLSFMDFVHPDERQAVWERYERILAGEWPSGMATIRGVDTAGRTLWSEIKEVPYSWQGKPAVMSLIHDISDRVHAEEDLKAREERFRTLIEKATDVVIVLDASGKITYQSPSLERVTGYGYNEWLDRQLSELLIHPDDMPYLATVFERVLAGPGATFGGVTVRYRHKDGSWHTLEATVTNMLHDPKVNGLVANFRDITDRKAVQAALAESEQKFRLLVENSSDVIFSLDAQANFTYVSPAIERIAGYRVDEVMGAPFTRLVFPEDVPGVMASFERTLAGASEPAEFRAFRKDGALRHIRTTSRVTLRDGQVVGVTGLMLDITDRKEAEEALKTSEALLRDTQELASVGGWEYDPENKKSLWTDETYRIHEIPKIPTIDHFGESLKCYLPEHRQIIARAFERCLEEGIPFDLELPFVTFRGNRRWVRAIGKAIREGDRTVRMIGNIADVTERKHAEEALREAKEYAENVIRTANVLVVGLDIDGNVTLLNEAGEKITGYKQSEVLGKNWFEIVVPRERYPQVWEEFSRLKSAGAIIDTFENPLLTASGEERIVAWKNSTLFLKNEVVGTLSFGTDITERKHAEEALRDSEAIYKRLFENTQTAMEIISGETGLVVMANESTARMFGFASKEELIGIDSMQFLAPEDRDRVATQMAQALADKAWSRDIDLRVRAKDGQWRWINALATHTEYKGKPALLISLIDLTSRKHAEDTLRESEEKYRLLAENTNDLIWTADINLRPTYMSPSVERIIGLTPGEGLKQSFTDIMTPESLKRAQEVLLHHLEMENDPSPDPNRTVRMELEFYRKDGSIVWLEEQVSGIRDAGGKLVGFHGVARDVTERRKAEEALKESEKRYRLLADNASDIIWVTDAEINITYASPSATSLLGYSMEEVFARPFHEFLTPNSLAAMTQVYKEDLERESQKPGSMGERSVEIEVVCKDGTRVWLEAAVSAVRDSEGRLTGFQGACRNITERKRVQEALEASEVKYRALFENALMGTEVIDVETGRVVLANSSIARMFDFDSSADLVGTNPMDYVLPENLEWMTQQMERTLVEPQGRQMITMRVKTNAGRIIWVTGSGMPFEYLGRKSILLSLVDVTATREAELKLHAEEERTRLLVENAAEGIAVIQGGLVTFANPKCSELAGRPIADLISKPFLELVHPDDRQLMADNYARRQAGEGLPNAYQFRIVDKQGNTKWLQINAVRLDWEGQEATLAMLSDVTDRVQAQAALAKSEERYRNLFQQTMMGMEVVDGQTGRVVLANRSMARMFGFRSTQDMIGTNPLDHVLPEDREWVARQITELMADPSWDKRAVIRARTEDGRLIWVTGMTTPLEYEGKPAMLISLVDTTFAKESELKLQESEEKNRLLIDNAAEGIAVIQDGVAKFFNRRLVELTGWTSEELLTRSFLDLVHPDERETIALNYMKRIGGEYVPNNYQFRIIDKEGNTKWVQISAVLFNWEGKPATLDMFSDVTERVKAEQAVRDSEERFRALIEEATDAVAVVDGAGKIVYNSPSIERVTGYTLGDWAGTPFQSWNIPPEDLASMASTLERLLKEPGKTIEGMKVNYMRKDGSWRTLEATVRNMLHDPKIGGIVANFRDITERVKSERELKESEERYRLVADNVSDVIWVTDLNLKPTYMSPSVTRMLGYTAEEALAGRVETRLTPASLKVAQQAYAKALAREAKQPGAEWEEAQADLEFIRKDGSTVWTSVRLTAIRGADGKPVAIVGVLRDIAERKKAEDSLRKSEERFRGLVETTSDWVWEMDQNSRYTYVSPKVRDILGYEPQELLLRTPFDFMHQRESRRVAKIVRRFAAAHLPFSLLENTSVHKDGHSVVLETSAVPILDNDGTFIGYRGINRDITERKQVEQELQRSLKQLEKTMESTIEAITTTIETRDPYTTGHQMRVTDLACAIAKVMELSPTQIEGIRVAGLVHDIGKIAVPTEILSKPGRLNEVEYAMIQTHTKVGYNILKKIEFPWPVARTVLQHHERWNGSGYPHGIRGEDILLEARILAVADVMEAMASHRPYRPSVGLEKALEEISQNSGILYDPAVADACLEAFKSGGFKFAMSTPGTSDEAGTTPSDHAIHTKEDR